MLPLRALCPALLSVLVLPACSSSTDSGAPAGPGDDAGPPVPSWLEDARVLVSGHDITNHDCRTKICRHNENTDLIRWSGAIFLVHRTAESQRLGPNSSLHVYRSDDEGKTFAQVGLIPAPADRDFRDPHFFVVGSELRIKALARLPVDSTRDSNVDTVALMTKTTDGEAWSDLVEIAPHGWSFWRIREHAGSWYSAAYADGDESVVLFSSTDGTAWTKGPVVYGVSADTPLETELGFMPSGRMLALVRTDGTDDELLGATGRLRTQICWATAPYDAFSCTAHFDGARLDGPLTFFHDGRLFSVARKHKDEFAHKRTALFEITGDFEGGALAIREWGELPSAGDTSYAGAVDLADGRVLVSWYSGDIPNDPGWALGMFDLTDIWQGTIDFAKLR